MSAHEKQPNGGHPMVFFGDWCGPGWSAGRKSAEPLTPADLGRPARSMLGRKRISRPSPVDAACKLHDIRYEAADRARDPVRRAEMIMAADRELLSRVKELHRLSQSGDLDLNLLELRFADNMQIAFRAKLLHNGRQIAVLRNQRALGPVGTRVARAALGPVSVVVLGMPSGKSAASKPAHQPPPTIVILDRDEMWMRALADPPSKLIVRPLETREQMWQRALAAERAGVFR